MHGAHERNDTRDAVRARRPQSGTEGDGMALADKDRHPSRYADVPAVEVAATQGSCKYIKVARTWLAAHPT